jgi:hypothetical protein
MSILSVLGIVVKPVGDYLNKRQEIKAEKDRYEAEERLRMHEVKLASLDRQKELFKEGLAADANWEMEFAKQAASSWKDEYTLLVVSIPAILCFIPDRFDDWKGGAYYVQHGMEALGSTPVWYQVMFVSIFMATYGIRMYRRTQYDTE